MKKIICILLASVVLISCSREKKPEDRIKEFHQSLINGDFEGLRDQCTSEGKDHLDDYIAAWEYFGPHSKTNITSVKCSEGKEEITCWCEEEKGYAVQYTLVKHENEWKINYRNYRPEIAAAMFFVFFEEKNWEEAEKFTTETGIQNLQTVKAMGNMGSNEKNRKLVKVTCDTKNEATICECESRDGHVTRYEMQKSGDQWLVDYKKELLQPDEAFTDSVPVEPEEEIVETEAEYEE